MSLISLFHLMLSKPYSSSLLLGTFRRDSSPPPIPQHHTWKNDFMDKDRGKWNVPFSGSHSWLQDSQFNLDGRSTKCCIKVPDFPLWWTMSHWIGPDPLETSAYFQASVFMCPLCGSQISSRRPWGHWLNGDVWQQAHCGCGWAHLRWNLTLAFTTTLTPPSLPIPTFNKQGTSFSGFTSCVWMLGFVTAHTMHCVLTS